MALNQKLFEEWSANYSRDFMVSNTLLVYSMRDSQTSSFKNLD